MKKRLLITSIVMMLVVAVALSTATYAWFTSNTQVSAQAVVLTAASADGDAILIAREADGTDAAASIILATTSNYLYPATPKAATAFDSAVTADTFKNLIMDGSGTYVDATSQMGADDVSFYSDTFYVFNKGSQGKRLVPVVNITYNATSNTAVMAAKSVRVAIVERTSKAEVELEADITGTADANLNAYSLKGIWQFSTTAADDTVILEYVHPTEYAEVSYYKDTKGTAWDGAAVSAENFDSLKDTVYIAQATNNHKNVATTTGANSAYGATGTTSFEQGTVNFTSGGDYTAFSVIPAATSGMQRAHEYTVVIWLEGWDADCTNQITSGSFSVDLSFTAGN